MLWCCVRCFCRFVRVYVVYCVACTTSVICLCGLILCFGQIFLLCSQPTRSHQEAKVPALHTNDTKQLRTRSVTLRYTCISLGHTHTPHLPLPSLTLARLHSTSRFSSLYSVHVHYPARSLPKPQAEHQPSGLSPRTRDRHNTYKHKHTPHIQTHNTQNFIHVYGRERKRETHTRNTQINARMYKKEREKQRERGDGVKVLFVCRWMTLCEENPRARPRRHPLPPRKQEHNSNNSRYVHPTRTCIQNTHTPHTYTPTYTRGTCIPPTNTPHHTTQFYSETTASRAAAPSRTATATSPRSRTFTSARTPAL